MPSRYPSNLPAPPRPSIPSPVLPGGDDEFRRLLKQTPSFVDRDPFARQLRRTTFLSKMERVPVRPGLIIPKIPYKAPVPTYGPGLLRLLRMHPALRTALNIYDVIQPFMKNDGPGGYDFTGWIQCFNGSCGVPSAYQVYSGGDACPPAFYNCLTGQVRATGHTWGDTIPIASGVRWIGLGPKTDPIPEVIPRYQIQQLWRRTATTVTTIPWKPGTRVIPIPKEPPLLTDFMPWLDPDLNRPGRFLPTPIPPPVSIINKPRPGRQRDYEEKRGVKRRVRTKVGTKPQMKPERPQRVELGHAEKKIMGPWSKGLLAVWDASTEAIDFVEALRGALPEGTCPGGSLSATSYCVYANFDKINWKQAVANVIYNAIEDGIAGRIIGKLDSVGIGVGFQGQPYLKQHMSKSNLI